MDMIWISIVVYLFGLWGGLLLSYNRIKELEREVKDSWELINELEDELYNA